ncbi:beta and beta-prime subunits of DNA dependent RNA-polymerase [Neocallimastix lanati (nom. inval.)]|nr:beta and beta-prime subunits of DNA dependent RNA-polymerase [Neocallimastix sp. JGI-2020a]
MNIENPVLKKVSSVSFSFYTSDEIRKLSVKQITNPVTLDNLGHPTTGGLYDLALGPYEREDSCHTCGLGYFECPGHFGHIELPVPLYNTIVFKTLYKLMQSLCFCCHHFRTGRVKMASYIAKYRLMYAGLLTEAKEIDEFIQRINPIRFEDEGAKKTPSLSEDEIIEEIKKHTDEMIAENPNQYVKSTLLNLELHKLEKEFLKDIPAVTCHNCKGISPKLRKEGCHKIFQKELPSKSRAIMNAKGISFEPLFKTETNEYYDSDEEINSKSEGKFITPLDTLRHMELLWKNEKEILDLIYGKNVGNGKRESSYKIFFLDVIPVSPSRFRPASKVNGVAHQHAQNAHLENILKQINYIIDVHHQSKSLEKSDAEEITQDNRIINSWINLQISVNTMLDNTTNPNQYTKDGKPLTPGIRQVLEKKEGLFRKHMMGKRVNYAARSVISPDVNIETNEIGIPPAFAVRLTYPEAVTQYNVNELHVWPGATHVQDSNGTLLNLKSLDMTARMAVANQLLTPSIESNDMQIQAHTNKKVYRHIRNGDYEKTLRMHYANCNTYNADFDVIPPELKLCLLLETDQQYLVPTDGGVLRGLIQDHVCAGVGMTSKDSFFDKGEYMQLVYAALRCEGGIGATNTEGNGSIEDDVPIGFNGRVVTLTPAIIKPYPMWTGKQIISTILLNLTGHNKPLNLESKAKIPGRYWGKVAEEEQKVIVCDGYLAQGIMDKSQLGASANGLVHAVYEVYGAPYAGKLLSILSRLLTNYLQHTGFSCRMDDLLLTPEGDKIRKEIIKKSVIAGKKTALKHTNVIDENGKSIYKESEYDVELKKRLEHIIRSDESLANLDGSMKGKFNSITSEIISSCIPNHLYRKFPVNNMQKMTVSGAKGSNVNVSQISCLLGQQELEGRRVPVMVSGKTLPSFQPFDTSARAGGYIAGRFLTGIKPQEYFFHCMAGREGLIDTAVKTSRSGYLQRCLVKHLEGLRVQYDNTVRDSDGSVVQFLYGEDSLDVQKQKTLNQFGFWAKNYYAAVNKLKLPMVVSSPYIIANEAEKYMKKSVKKPSKYDTSLSKFSPSRYIGSTSDAFYKKLTEYIEKNPDHILVEKDKNGKGGKSGITGKKFKALMNLKYMSAVIEPGESVGLLAAESIGEPSTQMTLNTFHFAGFGAKNVTLGIPRLREIIMTASDHIQTPMMTLPLKDNVSDSMSKRICCQLSKLVLANVINHLEVIETLKSKDNFGKRYKIYTVKLSLWSNKDSTEEYEVSTKDIEKCILLRFIKGMEKAIQKVLKTSVKGLAEEREEADAIIGVELGSFENGEIEKINKNQKVKDDEEDDATNASLAKKQKQQASYEGPDEEDKKILEKLEKEMEDTMDVDEENEDMDVDGEEEKINSKQNIAKIISGSKWASRYHFNKKDNTCEIDFKFPSNTKKILMLGIAEDICHKTVIREIKGISKCYPIQNESENDKTKNLATEGVNLKGLWWFSDQIDLNKIYSNDIAAILRTYGVEAARGAIIKEIDSVFGVYGISVDRRHLSLIADYMTFEGAYKPFNRMGIASNPSPFVSMSYETTMSFLTSATLNGEIDYLDSPSSRIVMGQPVHNGTGSFDVLLPVNA